MRPPASAKKEGAGHLETRDGILFGKEKARCVEGT
jgi:hypothetical protein